jgi:hypothetical protein
MLEVGWVEGPDGELDDSALRAEQAEREARNNRWLSFLASTDKRPCWDDFLELEAKREAARAT